MKAFLVKYNIFLAIFILMGVSFIVYYIIEKNTMTNNAFVVANVRPIAAEVTGYIDHIYVKNGQNVKQGDKLFSLNPEPYQYELDLARSEFEKSKTTLIDFLNKKDWLDAKLAITKEEYQLAKIHFDDANKLILQGAISQLSTQTYQIRFYEAKQAIVAEKQEFVHLENQIIIQKSVIKANKAKVDLARYDLEHTTVYAQGNGFITNLFIAKGTPAVAHEPLFSFVDTSKWFIQANFDETDLSEVRIGDRASIRLRIYLGEKIYHGKVVSINWAVNRQRESTINYLQEVKSENQWVLLPQRFPVMIEIEKVDPIYPLSVGASAYVEIKT
jgi:membrane fusion protein (multidrug efflux system)